MLAFSKFIFIVEILIIEILSKSKVYAPSNDRPMPHISKYIVSVEVIHHGENKRTDYSVLVHYCSGVVIHSRLILSPAHCFYSEFGLVKSEAELTVIVTNGAMKLFQVNKFLIHPNYNPKTNEPNLALLYLEREPRRHALIIAHVRLNDIVPQEDWKCTAIGWGHQIPTEAKVVPDKIFYGPVSIMEKSYCKANSPINESRAVQTSDICALDKTNSGNTTCRPNAVNLLFCNGDVLTGIFKYGQACGLEQPAYYTNIYSYRDWIAVKSAVFNEKKASLLLIVVFINLFN